MVTKTLSNWTKVSYNKNTGSFNVNWKTYSNKSDAASAINSAKAKTSAAWVSTGWLFNLANNVLKRGTWWKYGSSSGSSSSATAWNNKAWTVLDWYKFWKDVYNAWGSYDLWKRNADIANMMKQNGIKADNSQSVREFLEKYSTSYKDASDEDKNKTADAIYKLYSPATETPITNEDTIVEEWNWNDYAEWNEDYDYLWAEEWDNEKSELEKEREKWEQERLSLEEELYNYRNKEVDDALSNNTQEEEKKGLSEEQKQINTEASNAAWNMAQWADNNQPNPPAPETPLRDSSQYWDLSANINNTLSNLWYKIENAPSEQTAEAEVSNVMEWWQAPESPETQQAIQESNESNWEVTPTYTNEQDLVSAYDTAFQNLLPEWATPENLQKIKQTYEQAKDAAVLYMAQNNLSDEAYRNILKQIKWSPALRTLLENYRR